MDRIAYLARPRCEIYADRQMRAHPWSIIVVYIVADDTDADGTLRVMLVEDHAAFRQALAFLLGQGAGIEVVAQAGSLAQAREALLAEGGLDVAVLDLVLPDGDGSELIGELRQTNPDVSVVVLSAAMGPGDLDEAVEAGADAVLDKVESLPTIAEEIRRQRRTRPPPTRPGAHANNPAYGPHPFGVSWR